MFFRARHAVAIIVTSGLVLTGGAASAAQKSVKDKAKDAPATADITRVTIKNADEVLSIRVKLSKASAGRTHLVATLTPAIEGAPSYIVRTVVEASQGKGKKVGATLEYLAPDGAEAEFVECDGLKASVSSGRKGQSGLRIPQSCLGEDAGTLVVDVVTVDNEGELADELAKPVRVKQG